MLRPILEQNDFFASEDIYSEIETETEEHLKRERCTGTGSSFSFVQPLVASSSAAALPGAGPACERVFFVCARDLAPVSHFLASFCVDVRLTAAATTTDREQSTEVG